MILEAERKKPVKRHGRKGIYGPQVEEVGFRGTGADSKQIALPAARPGLGQ